MEFNKEKIMVSCLYTHKGNHAKKKKIIVWSLAHYPMLLKGQGRKSYVGKQNSPSKSNKDDSVLCARTAQSASYVTGHKNWKGTQKNTNSSNGCITTILFFP